MTHHTRTFSPEYSDRYVDRCANVISLLTEGPVWRADSRFAQNCPLLASVQLFTHCAYTNGAREGKTTDVLGVHQIIPRPRARKLPLVKFSLPLTWYVVLSSSTFSCL